MRWLLGLMAASGVFATIVGFGLPKAYDAVADRVAGSGSDAMLRTHIDDDGQFTPIEGTIWALAEPSPRVGEDHTADLRAAGAVAVNQTAVAATMENVGNRRLTIVSIRAVIETPRRDPFSGAIVRVAPGGGGTEPPPINVGFALDSADLEGRVMSDGKPGAAHYVDQHGVTLESGEQMRLRLAGHTGGHRVAWSSVVRYVVGGESHEATIGARGQFRVTAAVAAYTRAYELTTQALQPVPLTDICAADCRTDLKG